ncbi:MAG: hypothetical protein ACREC0_01910 [Methylocella sp.]
MTTTLNTGMPRSGTIFVCACLNALSNFVALVEPMQLPRHGDANRAVNEFASFAEATRTRILAKGVAPTTTLNGVPADNFFEDARDNLALRRRLAKTMDTKIGMPLAPDFRLFIKHPGIFTVLAGPLGERFPLYAIVRHPLGALASRQSVDTPIRHGCMSVAEAFAPDLSERPGRIDNPLTRQIALIQWMFQVYCALPRERVLNYGSIVTDPGALRPLSGSPEPITQTAHTFPLRTRYPSVDIRTAAEAFLAIEADVEPFYSDFAASLRPYLRVSS